MKKCCGVGGIYQRGLNARGNQPPLQPLEVQDRDTTTSGRHISDMPTAPPTMEDLASRLKDAAVVDEADVIAEMKRAVEGEKFEVDGRDGRGDAAWRLYEHYSAEPDEAFGARDLDKAMSYLLIAADHRHVEACWRQHKLLENILEVAETRRSTSGIPQDIQEAAEKLCSLPEAKHAIYIDLKRAADGGHILAILKLIALIDDEDHGESLRESLEMTAKDAVPYLQKAADKRNGEAMLKLAYILTRGMPGVEKDLPRAERLFIESEKPDISFVYFTTEQRVAFYDRERQLIIYERLLRGGDADATGYSFVHVPIESDGVAPSPGACTVCMKTGIELKRCAGCKVAWYCSKECQNAAWPEHKKTCAPAKPEEKIEERWFRTVPGLASAVILAAYINRNSEPVIGIRTEREDDGLRPVVTVYPRHEILKMNFSWSQTALEHPCRIEPHRGVFQMVITALHLGGTRGTREAFPYFRTGVWNLNDRMDLQRCMKTAPGVENELARSMMLEAWKRGRVAEVREHTNLE